MSNVYNYQYIITSPHPHKVCLSSYFFVVHCPSNISICFYQYFVLDHFTYMDGQCSILTVQ